MPDLYPRHPEQVREPRRLLEHRPGLQQGRQNLGQPLLALRRLDRQRPVLRRLDLPRREPWALLSERQPAWLVFCLRRLAAQPKSQKLQITVRIS